LIVPTKIFTQSNNKHKIYLYWGYNRERFSTSTIQFKGPEYDMTFHNLKAKDRPSPLSTIYLNPTKMSIPQYNIRIGYYITDRMSISFGSDHMKYVVIQNQQTSLSGNIHTTENTQYNGIYNNKPIKLSDDLVRFEHTDGLNVATLEVDYAIPLIKENKFALQTLAGIGGAWVICRSDVAIFNNSINNRFHLSGKAIVGKAGFRAHFGKHFFATTETKVGCINLPDVLIHNDEPKRANHRFTFQEMYVAIGIKYNLRKKK
jgi:hypothetical protein